MWARDPQGTAKGLPSTLLPFGQVVIDPVEMKKPQEKAKPCTLSIGRVGSA